MNLLYSGWLGGDKVYGKSDARAYCNRYKPPQDVISYVFRSSTCCIVAGIVEHWILLLLRPSRHSAFAAASKVTDRKAEEVGELAEQLNVLQSLADDVVRLVWNDLSLSASNHSLVLITHLLLVALQNTLRTVDNVFFYNNFQSKWRQHAG